MRTEKVDGATTKYFYDGQMPIEEDYNPSGTITKVTRNTLGGRGIDMISTTTSSSTEDRYPLYDGHGNMIATLGKNGSGGYAIGDSRTYDVWGSVRSGAASGDPTKRYSANLGHQADDESGLLYMRARYYEPGSGAFVSSDPSRHGANWYSYASANPVNRVDPDGREDVSQYDGQPWLRTLIYSGGVLGALLVFSALITVLVAVDPATIALACKIAAAGITVSSIAINSANILPGQALAFDNSNMSELVSALVIGGMLAKSMAALEPTVSTIICGFKMGAHTHAFIAVAAATILAFSVLFILEETYN